MKVNKSIKKIISTLIVVGIVLSTEIVTAFAADKVKINSKEFSTGDTVTYIADLKCDNSFAGLNVTLSYDNSSLELDEESLNVPNLGTTIANPDTEGIIRFAAVDAGSGFDFSEDKVLVSASFKIKDNASDNDITISINEALGTDLQEIPDSKYSLKETIEKGEYSGQIVNPVDGAEMMSENSGMVVDNNTQEQTTDTTDKSTFVWVVVGVAAAIVVLAIVGFAYRKKKIEQDGDVILSDELSDDKNSDFNS